MVAEPEIQTLDEPASVKQEGITPDIDINTRAALAAAFWNLQASDDAKTAFDRTSEWYRSTSSR